MPIKVKQEIDLDKLVFVELLDDCNFKHLIKQQHNLGEKILISESIFGTAMTNIVSQSEQSTPLEHTGIM